GRLAQPLHGAHQPGQVDRGAHRSYTAPMTKLKAWFAFCAALYLLPVVGVVPAGGTLHAACVLPLGLTLLILVPAALLTAGWVARGPGRRRARPAPTTPARRDKPYSHRARRPAHRASPSRTRRAAGPRRHCPAGRSARSALR